MSALPAGYHQGFNARDEIETTYKGEVIGTTHSPTAAHLQIARHAALRAETAERERDDLSAQIKAMRDNIAEIERTRFENTAPVDWRAA